MNVLLIFTDCVQIIMNFLPILGAYIKGRFTQKDLDQKAVRYVIAADMEVTADSFEFQVTDPAGNTMLPEVYIYSLLWIICLDISTKLFPNMCTVQLLNIKGA